MRNNPIGIFDSGIGGLTVAKKIIDVLPNESLIYLGDTARVPYGNRDKEVITKFALELTGFLLAKKVKALVVACNTISSISLEEIKKISPVPVIDVIKPTVRKAIQINNSNMIGVIGTRATVNSKIYEKEIKSGSPHLEVIQQACPLFVPLAEEGLKDNRAAALIAQEYLAKFQNTQIDTLILGCTHYPLLKDLINSVLDKKITLIDSAHPTALELKKLLQEKGLLSTTGQGYKEFYLTDTPEKVLQSARVFFNHKFPGEFKKIDIS
jgi:glutamate racemase